MKKFYFRILAAILGFIALASVFLFLLYLEGERRAGKEAAFTYSAQAGEDKSPVFVCNGIIFAGELHTIVIWGS